MAFVDERRPVAHVGEIDQGADQRRAVDLVRAALGGEPGQRDRDQGPAEAEGEQVGRLAGAFAHLADRLDDPFEDIMLDALVAVRLGRVDPADHEHGAALVDQPFDQARARHEVDHVVAVDQRRDVQQRLGGDLLGRGLVLDQLEQVVLEHDLRPASRRWSCPFRTRRDRCGGGPALCRSPDLRADGRSPGPDWRRWFPWSAPRRRGWSARNCSARRRSDIGRAGSGRSLCCCPSPSLFETRSRSCSDASK